MNRRGFSLVELSMVFLIVTILLNIAYPFAIDARRKASAARVIGDFKAIQTAVLGHFVETRHIPPSEEWGEIPPDLVSYLPAGFEFASGDVQYRWRRWSRADGTPRFKSQQVLMGLQVTASDLRLLKAIRGLYPGSIAFGSDERITLAFD